MKVTVVADNEIEQDTVDAFFRGELAIKWDHELKVPRVLLLRHKEKAGN